MLFYFFKVLLLFLLGVQKKKVTKRKNAGFRLGTAPKRFPAETQELASLSLRSNSLRFFSPLSAPPLFRPQTKAGTISLCRDARSVRPKTNHLHTDFLIIPTQRVKEYMHELKVSSSVKKRTHEPCVPTRNNIALH